MASHPADRLARIALIGFSGTGKTSVARALSQRLQWPVIDTDALIEQGTGRTIPEIFALDGEAAFRRLEREAVQQAAASGQAVIATGGGAFLDASNRRALAEKGFVVALEARISTILARLGEGRGSDAASRPLLAGPDPRQRIASLKARRAPFYALADATVHSDDLLVNAVVDAVLAAVERQGDMTLTAPGRLEEIEWGPGTPSPLPREFGADVACTVTAGAAVYPCFCGWGLLAEFPRMLDAVDVRGRVFMISDETVASLYAEQVMAVLDASGRTAAVLTVPAGETSKSLTQLERIYTWLAEERAERGETVLALGGGVVTDLAGAAAATYLRGMPLVQVPTTLLGMVDAAIGGKVAVDLPAGKNLVGAFHQPRAVLADVATLASLPARELRAGYAEVIKHALIRDAAMLDNLERDADALLALNSGDADQARVVALIGRNMAIKAAVVSADEREVDLRSILNYGHTLAHALEAVTAYGRFLHGEALGIGLVGAAIIAQRMGLIDAALVERHRTVVQRFELPVSVERGVSVEAVMDAIQRDKKVQGGQVRWVLLEGLGRPVLRADVPAALAREVVASLVGEA